MDLNGCGDIQVELINCRLEDLVDVHQTQWSLGLMGYNMWWRMILLLGAVEKSWHQSRGRKRIRYRGLGEWHLMVPAIT